MQTEKTPEAIEHFLDTISENLDRLSKWEHDFFDSVDEQYKTRNWISDKQFEILERIYTDRT